MLQDDRTTHAPASDPDFYLFLTEDRSWLRPSACRVRGVLRARRSDERLTVVDLEPPVPTGVCGTERELTRVLLAPRRPGQTLEDVLGGEVPVRVCLPKSGAIDLSVPGLLERDLCDLEWGRIRLRASR